MCVSVHSRLFIVELEGRREEEGGRIQDKDATTMIEATAAAIIMSTLDGCSIVLVRRNR